MSAPKRRGLRSLVGDSPRDIPDTDIATGVTSYLLAGPLTFGAIGYGLDRWLGTSAIVAVGVLVGVTLSVYLVWLRYGAGADSAPAPPSGPSPSDHDPAGVTQRERGPADRTTNEESQ